jgi:hypothetical protein
MGIVPGSYMWRGLDEPDVAVLSDPVSGRSTVLRRPPPELLTMEDIVRIETLAFRRGARPQAELFGALDSDPFRVLTAMNWLIAFWAVLWDLRAGMPADELIRRLSYARGDTAGDAERVWQSMSARVRDGVLAALTGVPEAHRAYESEVRRLAPDVFLHVTLTVMDDLGRDLTSRGLALDGMAAELDRHTSPGAGGPSFAPPR